MARPFRTISGYAVTVFAAFAIATCSFGIAVAARSRDAIDMVLDAIAAGTRSLFARLPRLVTWEPAPRSMTPNHGASPSNVAYLDQHRRAGHTVHPRAQSRTDHSRGVWRAAGA